MDGEGLSGRRFRRSVALWKGRFGVISGAHAMRCRCTDGTAMGGDTRLGSWYGAMSALCAARCSPLCVLRRSI